jgi:hypothetical protein
MQVCWQTDLTCNFNGEGLYFGMLKLHFEAIVYLFPSGMGDF